MHTGNRMWLNTTKQVCADELRVVGVLRGDLTSRKFCLPKGPFPTSPGTEWATQPSNECTRPEYPTARKSHHPDYLEEKTTSYLGAFSIKI